MADGVLADSGPQVGIVCLFLSPADLARLSSCGRTFFLSATARDPLTWQALLAKFFYQSEVIGPAGEDCSSPQPAFRLWCAAASEVGLPDARRGEGLSPEVAAWLQPWCKMRRWLRRKLPHVLATLQRPTAPEDFEELTQKPAPLVRALWEVCGGQNAQVPAGDVAQILGLAPFDSMQDVNWAQGLLGGYTAYDHEVSMVLLPLRSATRLTQFLLARLPSIHEELQEMLCFACSYNLVKIFAVNVQEGSVYTLDLAGGSPALNLAAKSLQGRSDGVLRWFSEFVRRCDTGVYTTMELRPESPSPTLGISLFPVSGPLISRCVTRGVVVCGACIYMPEHPQGWTYSLTFELEGTPEERGFETCQLSTRQWDIEDSRGRVEQVQGEGVIGLFPILRDGGWDLNRESDPHGQYDNHPRFMKGAFRYQSCSGRKPDMRGRFGGALTFVPGSRKKPTAPAFEARLIPFTLEIPEFVF